MKPILQTVFGHPNGNCFGTCIACILELPIESMPNFHGEDWLEEWNDWLKPMNIGVFTVNAKDVNDNLITTIGYTFACVRSPRGDFLHSVVCLDGKIIHDPHPDNILEYDEILDWTYFIILDPMKPINRNYYLENKSNE